MKFIDNWYLNRGRSRSGNGNFPDGLNNIVTRWPDDLFEEAENNLLINVQQTVRYTNTADPEQDNEF